VAQSEDQNGVGARCAGSADRGGVASGVRILASEANSGAMGVAAILAPTGAGRGNGILGRARGSGTRKKGSSGASSPVMGRSRFWFGGKTRCDNAGAAVQASTSAAKTVVRPDLVNVSPLHSRSLS
jgi:hypothetical protein